MNILYGISNCDTVHKARQWLDEREIPYEFHDFRQQGVNPVQLRAWVADVGWETLINKRSKTWRQLPEQARENMNETLALVVMEEQPTLIKRPVLETHKQLLVGFDSDSYRKIFQH